MRRLRIGVVGVGHLGKEHARILAGLPDVELVGVADVDADQAEAVALRCNTRAFTEYQPLLPLVDAAVIVTPTVHHYGVASTFLRRGVPLLVEKPLAPTLAEAEELVDLARLQGVVLQVGHIERFNPAFENLQTRPLQPKFISGQRLGLFSGRSSDIGAVLDLMIHDLDLLLTLVRSPVQSVEAVGLSVLGGHEDMAHARLTFDAATKQLLKNDLIGRHLQVLEMDCNQGDQLTRELEDFIHCVRTGGRPRVSGEDGRDAVALALRVVQSLENHAWNGDHQGPCGPMNLPEALGSLFSIAAERQAA
jgi:predicted dehydrogenase